MDRTTRKKVAIAKYTGSGFFITLALVYLVGNVANNHFNLPDFLLLTFTCLPVVINKRWIYGVYGFLYGLFAFYIGLAIMVKGSSDILKLMIFSAVDLTAILCCCLLIYSSISVSKDRFSII